MPDHTLLQARPRIRPSQYRPTGRPPFECVALLLQGGGALGSYQAGVCEALAEANLHPDWIAGISIGAINAALIAGNAPGERVAKLRSFWQEVTANPLLDWAAGFDHAAPKGNIARGVVNQMSAAWALVGGAPGFFVPRHPAPWLQPVGSLEATSHYETTAFGDRSMPFMLSLDAIWSKAEDDEANIAWVRQSWTQMQRHSTGRMYLNFPGLGEGERLVADAFGAETYKHLQALKRKYDPNNLFALNQNILPG